MKVLFLDVDGVLNTSRSKSIFALGKGHLRLLKEIVDETECKIVLSSTWRKHADAKRHLIKALAYRGMQLYSETKDLGKQRGWDIDEWLSMHTVDRYAILDDDSDMLDYQLKHFFQTDMDYGLTKTIAYRVKYHLTSN